MSRIGKNPVVIPDKVNVTIDGLAITAKGPLGEQSLTIRPEIKVRIEDNKIVVERTSDERLTRSLHGLTRTLIFNLVNGVASGFTKNLEIVGVGYRAAMEGKTLVLSLGYSHPVKIDPPASITITLEGNTKITVKGPNKQEVGDVAAEIRSKRPPEVYKGKGVKYAGEYIRRKAGKTGKK